jgi:uncharacterized protein (DUF1810 family)
MKQYSLDRFVVAQSSETDGYSAALKQVQLGRKTGHWIWYIFPQLKGLGKSETSEFFGIDGMKEAKAYLDHSILGHRLIEISKALLALDTRNGFEIFYRDAKKVKSCMELFSSIDQSEEQFFARILAEFSF